MEEMRILIDIGHPAHVHFFRRPIELLRSRGHDILVTSRIKEIAVELLDALGIQHTILSSKKNGGLISLGKELVSRNLKLLRIVRKFKPDIMAAIGGVNIAHVGKLTGIPSLVFYDTENATLQNAITYPFATCVIVPRCYEAWLPKKRHMRYAGYHELSYLHPKYFSADRSVALRNGLSGTRDTFFIRLVSWQASHDIGEKGWNADLVTQFVGFLQERGEVIISSENPLGADLERYRYKGNPAEVHHVMAFCRAFIGESATMASECAVLGVPAIYAATTGRGYTNEQETRYGLVTNIREITLDAITTAVSNVLRLADG
jgi:predicted glycosyltransferase